MALNGSKRRSLRLLSQVWFCATGSLSEMEFSPSDMQIVPRWRSASEEWIWLFAASVNLSQQSTYINSLLSVRVIYADSAMTPSFENVFHKVILEHMAWSAKAHPAPVVFLSIKGNDTVCVSHTKLSPCRLAFFT